MRESFQSPLARRSRNLIGYLVILLVPGAGAVALLQWLYQRRYGKA